MSDLPAFPEGQPLPSSAGVRLRAAREAQGLSLETVAERTRIPLRHLEAIETGDYSGLPSPTYAIGFARAYARVVGEDDVAMAQQVRGEAAASARPAVAYEPYVTADPARIPSRTLSIVAAGIGVAVLILAALFFGARQFRHDDTPAPAPAASQPIAAAPAPPPVPTGGQVTLTALDEVWLRVYDGSGKTLFLGTMKPGDHFDVPAAADRPMINVGRPDKLKVTLNGASTPPLGDGSRAIKDVPVDGKSIAARLQGAPATPTPSPTPSATTTSHPATHHGNAPSHPHRSTSPGDETARANRAAAASEPVPAAAPATPTP